MKVTAIIAEFNPFHNGHAWLIDQAKRVRGADQVVIVMSGNFVQRGEPAVFDKYERTRMALRCGADLVLELPTVFATASAREFARASVALAEKTGLVDELLFGAEPIDREDRLLIRLQDTAAQLLSEEDAYRKMLRQQLQAGESYPRARAAAFHSTAKGTDVAELSTQLLSAPNNILALEYLQALMLRGSRIRPALALRQGDSYHEALPSGSPFASATALRQLIFSGGSVSAYVPDALSSFYHDLSAGGSASPVCIGPDSLDLPLQQRLLSLLHDGTDLASFADVSPEIAARLCRGARRLCGFQTRIETLWTKQYTRSRISRALLHILLGITKEQTEQMKCVDYIPFLRVLGFSGPARSTLLPALKQCAKAPVITRAASAKELLSDELYYSDFYYALQDNALREKRNSARKSQTDRPACPQENRRMPPSCVKNELERQIVII